jgi:NSS family neurotransmitter:Na+ symporter
LIHAIGHVLFTLGVGFGIMTTFGSYLREEDHVPTVGFRLTLIDTILSFAAGLLVFPIALSASNIPLTDPGLMFDSLPVFLMQRPLGQFFGFAFFLCLYLAALGASVGLLEVIVSNSMMILKKPRKPTTWYSGLGVLVISFFPALLGAISQTSSHRSILEILDSLLVNWMMPLSALMFCYLFSKVLSVQKWKPFLPSTTKSKVRRCSPHWVTMIRFGIPGLILLGLALQILDLLT